MIRTLPRALALVGSIVVLPVLGAPAAAAPFTFDTAFGRLPKDVVPLDYRIAIVPDAYRRTIAGTESIALDVRRPTATIAFNTVDEQLTNVRLDGVRVATVATDNAGQITHLTLASAARPGRHLLTFAYAGQIETGPIGLFAQPYIAADGARKVMLSTQFEATQARRMFPCWDEPAFRARYTLTVTVPAAWRTISNMPAASRVVHGALATTTFRRTPKMPSYLVEFSAGELGRIGATNAGYGFGVVATTGRENDGRQALANAQTILADYNAYFAYPFPLPKLDSIAVPGGFGGAMENWGAITYNQRLLLLTAASTSRDAQATFAVQAHEMAHQWNGDLVTMGWWDDLWLNESFASWMSAKETDRRHPDWHWWQNQDASKESAMNADARTMSHPIQVHVANELQAETAFDGEITYAKGQAFLRMLESYVGDDTFRAGIRRYIKARAFSNATGDDLWNALSAVSHQNVAQLAHAWTYDAGFPLVSVATTCDTQGNRTIALSQHRFLLAGTVATEPHWEIPLRIRTTVDGEARSVLFTDDGQQLAAGRCGDPLSVNADAIGLYRTFYDAQSLDDNEHAFPTLHDGDRIALLDDQWALVRAKQTPLATYFAFASQMGSDQDARAWNQILTALETIERDERGTAGYDRFLAYARTLIKPLATHLGYRAQPGDAPDTIQLRNAVIADLGSWGDADVANYAARRFAAYRHDRHALSPDEQATVLRIVAANADSATFAQIHAIARQAKTETEIARDYTALASVHDPQLAREALEYALSSEIPPQASLLRVQIVSAAADEHPREAWRFFRAHWAALTAPLGPTGMSGLTQAIPQIFWRGAPVAEIGAFVASKVPSGMSPFIAKGVQRANFDLAERSSLDAQADKYVTEHIASR